MKIIIQNLLLVSSLSILSACSNDNNEKKHVQINPSSKVLTVVNIMKPKAEEKGAVLSLLKEGIDNTMRKQKGYISSSVHASMDNNYVINYSQWKSMDDLAQAGALVNSGGAPKMVEAFSKGEADYHPMKLIAQYKADKNKTIMIDDKGELLTIINILTPPQCSNKQRRAYQTVTNGISPRACYARWLDIIYSATKHG